MTEGKNKDIVPTDISEIIRLTPQANAVKSGKGGKQESAPVQDKYLGQEVTYKLGPDNSIRAYNLKGEEVIIPPKS